MNPIQRYFIQPITTQYADFTGRTRRRDFWMYSLFTALLSLVLSFVDSILGLNIGASEGSEGFGVLSLILSLALFIPGLAIMARRLHDIGRSGWWMLIILIPFIGAIVLFVFEVLDSQPVDNKWGPDPKAEER